MPLSLRILTALVVALSATASILRAAPSREGAEHVATVADGAMVATVHPLATEAALQTLGEGGNAVDAAVAAALTLGVVDGHNSGIGGGCFLLLRRADGRVIALDGRETAPATATRDMYLRGGRPQPELSQVGPLAVATPGALAAYDQAVRRHGRLSLAKLLRPAANLAERGFPVNAHYAARLKVSAPLLRKFPAARRLLFRDGRPLTTGDALRQPDLARTYRNIADEGVDWFYRGEFAERVGDWMAKHEGKLTAADFAAYRTRKRRPLKTRYREYTVLGFPPPSSGGVHVAQILNICERFDLAAVQRRDKAAAVHIVAEAMKRAFADRAHWLGDPDFAEVPRGLASDGYARRLATQIDLSQATPVAGHGQPPQADQELFERHTTHIAVVDREGNWVALTATLNLSFGSKVMVPGTGVFLNNQMDDFSIQPGEPNAFGLIGAEANAIEPGKRPLSSMSPTIVLRDGEPVLTLGAAGGPMIISQVAQTVIRRLDFGQPLPEAVAAPRFHHQWRPDTLYVERKLAEAIGQALHKRGHRVAERDYMGFTQAIGRQAELDTGQPTLVGVADPRTAGRAEGWKEASPADDRSH